MADGQMLRGLTITPARPAALDWLDAAGSLIGLGYDFLDATADIGPALAAIVTQLARLTSELDYLNSQLDRVIEQIRRAADEIQGHLDQAFLQQAISDVNAAAQNIVAHMRDGPTFQANIQSVQRNLADLSAGLFRINKFTDGLGLLSLCGPGYALWAQAHMSLMRVRNPGTRVWIWEHPVHVAFINRFKDLLVQASDLVDRYQNDIQKISLPDQLSSFQFSPSSETFYKFSHRDPPPDGPFQYYTLNDEVLAGGKLLASSPTAGPYSSQVWRYADSRGPFADESEVRKCLLVYENAAYNYRKMRRHIELASNSLLVRDRLIAACEARPSQWPKD